MTMCFYFNKPLNADREFIYVKRHSSPSLLTALSGLDEIFIVLEQWEEADLTFLEKFSNRVRFLQVGYSDSLKNVTSINKLTRLSKLRLSNGVGQIDFSELKALRECELANELPNPSISSCGTLRDISFYMVKLHDLSILAELTQLRGLGVFESPLKSLNGVSQLQHLEDLGINQVRLENLTELEHLRRLRSLGLILIPKLHSLEAIRNLRSLESLNINTCKYIKDVEVVWTLTNLRSLALNNIGDVRTFQPMRGLPHLEKLEFYDSTNVLDGRLEFLLEMPHLKQVTYKSRRHYNVTRDEIERSLAKKGPEAAPCNRSR